jgi:branched-chain amino acid transport system ATP-binding protein
VSFGGVQAVRDVDLAVRRRQVLGLIGHNGAGKTTLFDLLSGFLVPTGGEVILFGTDMTNAPPDRRAMARLGRSFQDAALFPTLTVREAIATSLERHIPSRDPLAAALGSPATRASERVVAQRVDELVDLMNLGAYANKFVSELSTGTRRVVDLACLLAHRPEVVLIDEPSSGIAQRETEALGPMLLEIRDRTETAMVVIEHDMPLISSISDELVALDLGRVIARGEPTQVLNDPRVVASYLGSTEEAINRSGTRDRRSAIAARAGRR